MLMDDYEMKAVDPWHYVSHKEFQDHPRLHFRHPHVAIDAFLAIYRGMYERVIDNFQVGVRKVSDLGGKNLGVDTGSEFYYVEGQ